MDTHATTALPAAAVVFVVAGLVKGVTGMGLPTLAMALLSFWMPPAAAATLMVLPSLLTNVAQCLGPHTASLTRRLWPLWLGLAGAAVFSPLPDLGSSGRHAQTALGAVLVAYGLWGGARSLGLPWPTLRRVATAPRNGERAPIGGALVGVVCGLATVATGVFVFPLVPYLQSLQLEKEELVQALGLSFTVATLALALRLGHVMADDDGRGIATVAAVACATAAAFAGMALGTALRRRLHAALFQRALYAVFVALGVVMVVRPV